MKHDNGKPPSSSQPPLEILENQGDHAGLQSETIQNGNGQDGFIGWLKGLLGFKPENTTLRDALEEYIEESTEEIHFDAASVQERAILGNILKLRDVKVIDVMIPRADIAAIDENTSQDDLLNMLSERQFSRIPVYRENLDNVLGTLHIKDVLSALAKGQSINIPEMINEIPIVSPSMHVLDLILEMRENRRHMALVVDEHGGIDGLVTINDVIEAIVGDLHDEHDTDEEPQIVQREDGSLLADARLDIDELEEQYGSLFTTEERAESDTIGGIVCDLAGHVPTRGEILTHDNGTIFEILDADPRRVKLIRIRNIPDSQVS